VSGARQSDARTWSVRGKVAKVDSDERRVFGWASIITNEDGSELTFDHHNTLIPVRELEEASYEYVSKSREAGVMHEKTQGIGKLIASIVMTPNVRKAMGLDEKGPIGWFVGFEVECDETWNRIKSGELAEFSIGGEAFEVPVT
jgi:hypothetical protein